MAYFSNGTEGEAYFEQWCSKCEFLPEVEDRDCPIRSAHFFYNYDRDKNPAVKSILDSLIPMKPVTFKDGITCNFPAECAFFRHRTERLPFDEPEADPAIGKSEDVRQATGSATNSSLCLSASSPQEPT